MSSVPIAPGSSVPLALLLEDGAAGKFPQAEIRDPAGTLLNTLDLTHIASGHYTNTTFLMPDEAWVAVVYIVYNEIGHTTESIDHLRDQDVFTRDEGSQIIASGVAP